MKDYFPSYNPYPKRINIFICFIFFMLIALSVFNVAAESSMQVITLENRPAEEIQPLIAPFLAPSERIIANGSNLIIRSTPERLVEIEQLISQLDQPLINLLISVAQENNISADEMNARAKIKVNIPVNEPSASSATVKGRISQNTNVGSDNITQQVRTMDGQAAFIQVGDAHPVQNRYYSGYPTTTEYINTTTGFSVTPRLRGKQVIIEISPWSDRMQRNGVIQTQGAQTTIEAQLGEWIKIGRLSESSQSSQKGLLSLSRGKHQKELHILIKVEKTR